MVVVQGGVAQILCGMWCSSSLANLAISHKYKVLNL